MEKRRLCKDERNLKSKNIDKTKELDLIWSQEQGKLWTGAITRTIYENDHYINPVVHVKQKQIISEKLREKNCIKSDIKIRAKLVDKLQNMEKEIEVLKSTIKYIDDLCDSGVFA